MKKPARGQVEPVVLPPNSPALHLVQRQPRDEAHRFAVTYHRQRRDKAMTRSALDALAGVGPVRRKRLLTAFGSVAAIKRAAVDEIAAVKGAYCRPSRQEQASAQRIIVVTEDSMHLVVRFIVNALALYLIARYVPGFNHGVTP